AIERFSNLTKEDAVKFLQYLATDYAEEKEVHMMFFPSAALFGLLFARAIYHQIYNYLALPFGFSNLTKEDAVKFLQDLTTDYAEEKLKNYLEEKIQGLLQGKDEKNSE
nr:hypothetical protein [Tanacetum cinerariifolium]